MKRLSPAPGHWELARRDACAAALIAWKGVEPFYEGENAVEQKKDGPATEADQLADRLIIEHLEKKYPRSTFGFLTEESEDSPERLTREQIWVIDPIDGTREFIKKSGHFAIQIALIERKPDGCYEPVVAVVYCPVAALLYSAIAGEGTYRQQVKHHSLAAAGRGERLHVSKRREIGRSRAVVSHSNANSRLVRLIEGLGLESYRRVGSLGVKICAIADGEAELYVITALGMVKEWDACAPQLILTEAGGRMTDLLGRPLAYNGEDVRLRHGLLASNGTIHERWVERVGAFFEREGISLG